jgi:hypothetical protein
VSDEDGLAGTDIVEQADQVTGDREYVVRVDFAGP